MHLLCFVFCFCVLYCVYVHYSICSKIYPLFNSSIVPFLLDNFWLSYNIFRRKEMHWTTITLSHSWHTTHEFLYVILSLPNRLRLFEIFLPLRVRRNLLSVYVVHSFIHSFSSLSATFQINLHQINNRASIGHCCYSVYDFFFFLVAYTYFWAVNGSYCVTSTPIIMTNNLRIQ